MNCQDIQKFSFTYLDGEFAEGERAEFEEHLRRCPPCKIGIDREAMMRDVISRHMRPTPCGLRAVRSAPLRAKVCAGLDRVERQHRNRAVGVVVVSVAAVALAVAVGHGVPGDRGQPAAQMAQGEPVAPRLAAVAVRAAAPAAVAAAVPQAIPQAIGQVGVARAANAQLIGAAVQPAALQPASLQPAALAAAGGPAGNVQKVAARVDLPPDVLANLQRQPPSEVLQGRLPAEALRGSSPFGAVRSEDSLRQLVQLHTANLQPEVVGAPARIQRYLQSHGSGVAVLPLAQGAGVQLLGARIYALGGQPVVIYSYLAFGSALTVVSRARAETADADVEPAQPNAQGLSGVVVDHRNGLHLLHAVAQDRVLTLVGELPPQAMLKLLPAAPLL